jgi:hypothetical protein
LHFEPVISELVVHEAESGDPAAVGRRMEMLRGIPTLAISDEATSLAEALVCEGPIPRDYGEDALHIALCAVNGIDFLLTWNCKHLANALHFERIEEVVAHRGYQCPIICTLEELMEV